MNIEVTPIAVFIVAGLGLMAALLFYDVYGKHRFWKFIEHNSDVGNPEKLMRLYQAQEVDRRGDNR